MITPDKPFVNVFFIFLTNLPYKISENFIDKFPISLYKYAYEQRRSLKKQRFSAFKMDVFVFIFEKNKKGRKGKENENRRSNKDSFRTVSYTHLDVYKRQAQTSEESNPPERRNPTLASATRRFFTPAMSRS